MRAFLQAYRTVGVQTARVERVLAVGRAFLATTGLVAVYLDPTEPVRFATVMYALLVAYAAYSLLVLALLRHVHRVTLGLGILLHGIDIVAASALTLFSDGPLSPYFLFFIYVLLAAAYRWGFRETLITASVTLAILFLQMGVAALSSWRDVIFTDGMLSLNALITHVAYVLLVAFLLGYLADQHQQLRAEIAAAAEAMRQPRVDLGLGGSVTALGQLLIRMFEAARLDIVLQEHESGRTALWEGVSGADAAVPASFRRVELDERHRAAWLFDAPARTWCANRPVSGTALGLRVKPGRWSLVTADVELPDLLLDSRDFGSITAVDFGLSAEWRGRLLLYDVAGTGPTAARLHFLEGVADQVTPVLSNVVLIRRLRSRAGAAERARVARELHDGSIQALIGIELEIEALRRRIERDMPALEPEVAHVQRLVREEVIALREVMQALRPVEIDTPAHLPDVLAMLVERFRRDTGISVRFAAEGSTAGLPLRTAVEIVRIVQEALVNVRKHSRARNVLVRLEEHGGAWVLSIQDDGTGFGFEGRLSGAELGARLVGPSMIIERARTFGGEVAVDSTPGAGARIEVRVNAASQS